jgi:hypothetical protein
VDDRNVNATREKIDGVDVSASDSFATGIGVFNVSGSATYLTRDQQLIPGVASTTLSGLLFYPSKLRARAGLAWARRGMSANASVNYISGETDTNVTPQARIAAWTTLDLNLAYRWPGLEAALSMTNALDRDPPFARGAAFQTAGLYFDSANASIMGRVVAVTLRKHFP